MGLSEDRIRSIIESILLTSPDPVPVGRLVEVVVIEDPQTDEESVRTAIKSLMNQYQEPDRPVARGFRVADVGGGLQLRTVPENAQYVRRFLAAKPQRMSKAALETLSIIAYRQPCTKPEIEAIRGVDVGAALKNLLDRDFVRIMGKKDEVGRP
ncbi:MAG: SMC-Scp complex subunit ScpB, partial [Myxococcota bacterium]